MPSDCEADETNAPTLPVRLESTGDRSGSPSRLVPATRGPREERGRTASPHRRAIPQEASSAAAEGHALGDMTTSTSGICASKMARSGDTVFKPVNAQGQSAQRTPSRVSTSPCTPPPPPQPGSAEADTSKLCDTPRPDKTPSENGIGHKRSFELLDAPAASEAEASAVDEELRSSRPSRHCRDMAIKKMRTDGTADDDYASDLATPARDSRRQAEVRPVQSAPAAKSATPADTRNKGPCSYEQCPNPNHSSGGGFKVVSHETKAGNRDWSCFAGRTFCNACFTQYATRGTLQRPGRLLPGATICPPAPSPHADFQPATDAVPRALRDAAPAAPAQPAHVRTSVEVEEGAEEAPDAVLELELTCLGQGVEYQWLHDGRPISGAVRPTLVVENPRGVVGEVTCRVRNQWGQVPPFAPVRLPLSADEARNRYAEAPLPAVSSYRLQCVCGEVREGDAEEIVKECGGCGLACCGEITITYADGAKGPGGVEA